MPKILVTEGMHENGPNLLHQAGYDVVYLKERSQEELAEKIKDVDALFVRIMDITADMLKSAPNLKMISKHGVGYDNIDVEAAKKLGIVVTLTPDANGLAVAEHAFSLMMSLAKNIAHISNSYKTTGFECRNKIIGLELTGKTLGIIGCGRIGKRVAKMGFGGFGMKVLVYDPYITQVPEGCFQVDKVEELFAQSDFVTLHAPLTDETKHMINASTLAMMKPTAIFVNCARGPMVDEAALVEALKAGKIAGAGLDVTSVEPIPADHPLFSLDNAIITPHSAPSTKETSANVSRIGGENLIAFFSGKEPVGRLV